MRDPVRRNAVLAVFSYGDVEFGQHIGKGNFGDVWQGVVAKLNNRVVAIKVGASSQQPGSKKMRS